MPKFLVLIAVVVLFLHGILLVCFSVFDRNYDYLGIGGCVLMGSAVIAAAIVEGEKGTFYLII